MGMVLAGCTTQPASPVKTETKYVYITVTVTPTPTLTPTRTITPSPTPSPAQATMLSSDDQKLLDADLDTLVYYHGRMADFFVSRDYIGLQAAAELGAEEAVKQMAIVGALHPTAEYEPLKEDHYAALLDAKDMFLWYALAAKSYQKGDIEVGNYLSDKGHESDNKFISHLEDMTVDLNNLI